MIVITVVVCLQEVSSCSGQFSSDVHNAMLHCLHMIIKRVFVILYAGSL